jgi:NADPH2:quinone reductase
VQSPGPGARPGAGRRRQPAPKKNEILLDVHAAGVNFPDTLIIEGKYQFQPPFPFSPGGEAAGVVAQSGKRPARSRSATGSWP